ncbi:hypothetical protein C8F01DRAFT_1114255 [Mycena amicta]|nr:hypothetical protein C8F01DRAFT_1114255 [Mycena amicta]
MDLRENSSGIVTATFELPGMVKENVHLDAFPGRLQISADSGQDPQLEDRYAVRERRYDKFSRTLRIPLGVTASAFTQS